jgi:hypothetical protein
MLLMELGMARVVHPGDTQVNTVETSMVGYMAPEYGQTWRATAKGGVYSYDVLRWSLQRVGVLSTRLDLDVHGASSARHTGLQCLICDLHC